MNIPDANHCSFFSRELDKCARRACHDAALTLHSRAPRRKTGFRTRAVLCMPIKDNRNTVIGVLQAINKYNELGQPTDVFTEADAELFEAVNHEIANVLKRKARAARAPGALSAVGDRTAQSLEATFARVLDLPGGETDTKAFIRQYMRTAGGFDDKTPKNGQDASLCHVCAPSALSGALASSRAQARRVAAARGGAAGRRGGQGGTERPAPRRGGGGGGQPAPDTLGAGARAGAGRGVWPALLLTRGSSWSFRTRCAGTSTPSRSTTACCSCR